MSRTLSYCDAIHEALYQAMEADPSVIVMGEGVDDPRAIFGSTRGLHERFGAKRVADLPLSENGMTGVMIGAALTGLRPVMTHQRLDFTLYAMDQLVNHAAKRCYTSGGVQSVPLTIRAIVGRGWGQGSQHSQSLHAWFAHIPGLKVIMPATPSDMKGLLLAAIRDPNPVICIEHRKLYEERGDVPERPYTIPLGKGIVRRQGTDVTIVAVSSMVVDAMRAASLLEQAGISVELIDPRTVKPLDVGLIVSSVEKTGRFVIADPGGTICGLSAELAAVAAERAFSSLKAPIRRVALPDVPTPTSHVLERAFYPGANEIVQAVFEVMGGVHRGKMTAAASTPSQPTAEHVFVGPF